ncbi:MAG: TonB-dependent receptor [Rikenellaceae bacterium]
MKRILTLFALLSIGLSATAQQLSVGGVVRDESGMAMVGATVMIKNTTTGSVTDIDGRYSINANMGDTLVCSYIGYELEEAVVTNELITFNLNASALTIDDIVVVGYSSVKKGDVTGSVTSIKMDEMSELTTSNSVMNSLQGRVAGLQIVSGGQDPGSSPSIIIRGASSLNGTQQPLVVLNGFPLGEGADLKQINPDDIEDLVVLKDASSTSIYGSRGANGVILVTTKKSKIGEKSITLSHQTTISQNTSEYNIWRNPVLMAQLDNESRINGGQDPYYVGREDMGIYYPSIEEISSGAYPVTQWDELVTRTPIVTNTSIGFRGADERTNYNLSFNHYDEKGIYIGDDYNKLSVNLDLNYKLYENFSIKTSTVVSTNNHVNPYSGGIDRNILYPVYNEDGTYFKANTSDYSNPIALRENRTNTTKGMDLISSVLADWEIIDNLSWKNQLNFKYGSTITDQYDPKVYTLLGELNDGRAYLGNWKGQELLYESYISYNKTFNGKHYVSALAGYSYSEWSERSSSLESFGFANESLGNENMGAGDPELNTITNGMIETKLMSAYGKLNYSYDDKYLLTATFRTDGSSKFGSNNRWAAFPSFAFAWKLHNESFMDNVDFVNEAKIRTSFGYSGNQGISAYQTLSRYGMEKYYVNGGWNTAVGPGYVTGSYGADWRFKYWGGIPNSDLKWETTSQLNLGADLGLLNNKVRVTFDWYDKNTSDLLRERYLPLSSGFDKMMVNDGELRNRGIEATINWNAIDSKDFYLGVTAIFSRNRNKIISLGDALQSGLQTDPNTGMKYEFTGTAFNDYSLNGMPNILAVGQPINTFYGYKVDGIVQTNAEGISAGLTGDAALPGEYKYVDLNGDGVVNDNDRTIIGDPNPDFTASLNLSVSYKNFDASLFINGVFGGDVLNPQAFNTASTKPLRWTVDNPTNDYPSLRSTRVPLISDWFIEDGSYVRLQDFTVGYSVIEPVKFLSKLRIYCTINNLYTFTKFSGYDPEVGMDGIYWGGYPRFRRYTFGINLTF